MHAHVVFDTALHAPISAVGAGAASLFACFAAFLSSTLPALLAALGLYDAAVSAHTSSLLTLARSHQALVFAMAAIMLILAAWTVWRMDARHCPLDLEQAQQYRRLRHWNRWTLQFAAIFWLAGIVATYVTPSIRAALV